MNLDEFMTDSYFAIWFEEYRDSDNFEDNIGFHDHNEARGAFEEESLSEDEIDQEMEILIKDKAYDYFNDRIYDACYDIMDCFDGDYIILKRCLMVKKSEFLKNCEKNQFGKFEGVGIYWSWDHSKADSHWGHFDAGNEEVEVLGKVKASDIDWDATISLNMCPSLGQDEAEIRLKKGTLVEIIKIDEDSYSFLCAA